MIKFHLKKVNSNPIILLNKQINSKILRLISNKKAYWILKLILKYLDKVFSIWEVVLKAKMNLFRIIITIFKMNWTKLILINSKVIHRIIHSLFLLSFQVHRIRKTLKYKKMKKNKKVIILTFFNLKINISFLVTR
jgi:hypothetical protein